MDGNTSNVVRLAKACSICRRKKVKCDGTRPVCVPCRTFDLPCKYEDTVRRKKKLNRYEHFHELEQRIQSLQGELNQTHASKRQRLLSDEETGPEHIQPSEASDSELPSPRNDNAPASFEAEADRDDGDGGSYTLKTPQGSMRFFGASSHFSIVAPEGVGWLESKTGNNVWRHVAQRNSTRWRLADWPYLDPNVPSHIKHEFWMINALPAGPRSLKHSTSLCTMPDDFEAGYGGAQAEAVTLTADHTPGKPSWITFCAGVWSVLQFQTKVWYQPAQKAAVVKNGEFLYNMIHNTPERLLAHEFTHGHTQFGAYRAMDKAYGWGPIVALAKKDNAQTDATQSLAVINADTFTYWINGVYLEMCNFRSGRCEDPDEAAKTP
ncbi:transcriptional regulator family: Fungal Specific TF [Penicillium roqueforti]|nr:transcriptional regulator family: Fungal Specific TF [Penicillium roqueforti]KAI2750559.1 transcriptional regulator family: Fungal Specific TF [Penicillium roqueforti]KAI2766705.1 transcriptional regulator family: Fungal Specific TF [Penicillium roqueforti]KAI3067773.1 transcriptional regulator family: Fungal Specific TF [Penicillium roqueforti]KAI3102805.1 transcriptional regulator family: Fungal Specific TF [Penicillium roqueforti]